MINTHTTYGRQDTDNLGKPEISQFCWTFKFVFLIMARCKKKIFRVSGIFHEDYVSIKSAIIRYSCLTAEEKMLNLWMCRLWEECLNSYPFTSWCKATWIFQFISKRHCIIAHPLQVPKAKSKELMWNFALMIFLPAWADPRNWKISYV